MRHLTELDVISPDDDDNHTYAECITALTGLKSLTLAKSAASAVSTEVTKCLTLLSQLTRLCLSTSSTGYRLHLPTTIADLSLNFYQDDPPLGMSQALMSLSNLSSLEINSAGILQLFQSDGVTPSCFFKCLSNLKALKTQNVVLCRFCLEALATLPDLTELRFSEPKSQVDPDLTSALLSSFSKLRVLHVPSPQHLIDQLIRGELKGCLSGLREFYLPSNCVLDANMQSAMLKLFPCLRLYRHPTQTSTC